MLRRRRRRGCVLGRRQPATAILVGAVDLLDRRDRPFLERQGAVAVGVELAERLPPWVEQLVGLDPPVLVLIRPAEALFLAALSAGFRRLERNGSAGKRGEARRWRRRKPWPALGMTLPQQESAGHEQEAGRGPGEESPHRAPPSNGDSACAPSVSERSLSTPARQSPSQAMT